jgi:hypothetical protein
MDQLFSRWKHKRKKPSSGWYKKNSIIKSFFRFLKNQPELKKLTVIPLCLIILVLLIVMLFIAPSNGLIENLFVTFIGILIVITFISFIQYRESQKRFFPIFHKINEDIVESIHTFIRILFEEFLAPSPSEGRAKYISLDNEPYCTMFSYKNYLRKSDQFLKLAKDISIEKIEKKEKIRSARLFLNAKNILIDSLKNVKRDYISILDLVVLNAMENFLRDTSNYEKEKPEEDSPYHIGIWARTVTGDIQSTLGNCFTLLEAVKQWDQDLDKTLYS